MIDLLVLAWLLGALVLLVPVAAAVRSCGDHAQAATLVACVGTLGALLWPLIGWLVIVGAPALLVGAWLASRDPQRGEPLP